MPGQASQVACDPLPWGTIELSMLKVAWAASGPNSPSTGPGGEIQRHTREGPGAPSSRDDSSQLWFSCFHVSFRIPFFTRSFVTQAQPTYCDGEVPGVHAGARSSAGLSAVSASFQPPTLTSHCKAPVRKGSCHNQQRAWPPTDPPGKWPSSLLLSTL